MLGGYQILDLRKIDLTITKTLSNITDAYVLAQLLKLRDFIDKDYDFSKPIENQLKPVLIRYRDKKNGEKNEGAMFGELAIVDNYYTFQITGRISGYLILTIKVAFQETTNAYGAKEWVINTAKIKLQDVMDDLEGNLALEGDLDVSGDLDVGGDAEVTGDASVGGDLEVTGDVELNGEVTGDKISKVFNGNISVNVTVLGLTVVASFVKVVRNFNELQFIFNCRLQNETESAITITNDTSIANFDVNDNDIQSKIYAHDGQACAYNAEVSRGSVAMTTLYLSQTTGLALEHKNVNLYHTNGNFNFYLEGGSIEIASNGVIDLEARISLAL